MSKFFEKPLSKDPSDKERENHLETIRTLIALCNEVLDEEADRYVSDGKMDHVVLDAPGARLVQLTALLNELKMEEEYSSLKVQ